MLRYSRAFEREADDFAIGFLKANGMSVGPLLEFFMWVRKREISDEAATIPGFLTSHPPTRERIERLTEEVQKER